MTIPKAQAPAMVWPREGSTALLWPPSAQVSSTTWPLPSQAAAMALPSEDGSAPSPGVLRPTRAPAGPDWTAGLNDRAGALATLTAAGTLTATATGYTGWSSANYLDGAISAANRDTFTLAFRVKFPPKLLNSKTHGLLNKVSTSTFAPTVDVFLFDGGVGSSITFTGRNNAGTALFNWTAGITAVAWDEAEATIFFSWSSAGPVARIVADDGTVLFDTNQPSGWTAGEVGTGAAHRFGRGTTTTTFWGGEIREVALFDTALTLAQCEAIVALVGPAGAPIDWASAVTPPAHRWFGRSDAGATLADADGGGAIAPTGDVWPGLGVEPYVSAGDTLGVVRPFDAVSGLPTGSVIGMPGKARKDGFDAFDTSNQALWDTGLGVRNGSVGTDPLTIRVRIRTAAVTWPTTGLVISFTGAAPTDYYVGFTSASTIRWRMPGGDAAMSLAAYVNTAQVFDMFYILNGDAPRRIRALIAGTEVAANAPGSGGSMDYGPVTTRGPSAAHAAEIVDVWDTALSLAQCEAVSAGAGPTPLTRIIGLVSGIVDPSDATLLAYQSAGTPGQITAEPAP